MLSHVRSIAFAYTMIAAGAASAATVIVPDDNPSVRDAVENAAPGDVIQVRPGTYSERVRVDDGQTGLTIEGVGGIPILQPPPGDDGIRIKGVDGVTVRSLTVSGGDNGVRIDRAVGTTLIDVGMAAPRGDGVRMKDAANTTLDGVLTTSCGGRSVRVIKSDGTSIADSVLQSAHKENLRIQTSEGIVVSNTTAVNGESDGIRIIKCPNATITDTVASGHARNGIRVQTSSGLVMTNDTADDNGRYGTWVKTSPPVASVADLTGAGNTASGNGSGDLRVD
jgi:hypothetical protein